MICEHFEEVVTHLCFYHQTRNAAQAANAVIGR
jgi:hypothetical protein